MASYLHFETTENVNIEAYLCPEKGMHIWAKYLLESIPRIVGVLVPERNSCGFDPLHYVLVPKAVFSKIDE